MSGREAQIHPESSGSRQWSASGAALAIAARVAEDDRLRRVATVLKALRSRWPEWLSVEIAVLAVISVVLGKTLVRAHWSSIWMDREFTGWVSGAALRLAEGHKLYADGAHTPLPPLSFCLVYFVSLGQPRWITESTANFVFQALTLAVMWLGLRRYLPRSAALIGCLAAGANFFSLPKQLLYDSMAQFLVAATVSAVAPLLIEPADAPRHTKARSTARSALVAAAALAACALTKQSTALGLLIGTVLALLVARTPRSWRERLRIVSILGLALAVFTGLGLLLLYPWLDPRGFLEDAVRFGSETKGGLEMLKTSLRNMCTELWRQGLELGVPPVIVLFAVCAARSFRVAPESVPDAFPRVRRWASALASGVTSGLVYVAVVKLERGFAETAMLAALFLTLVTLLLHRFADTSPRWADALFVFACVTLPAALGHNLSVSYLRWTYDNNPLIVVVLATLAALAMVSFGPKRASLEIGYAFVVTLALQAMVSGGFNDQWLSAKAATVRWAEVEFLKNARLRPSADGMRNLVNRVRELAPDPRDTVLLLPNDPNVEAWFERRRPALTSLILFADQYRDVYVDEDVARLLREPPRVIVIGPRDYWRSFSHGWQRGTGVERLIDRVLKDVIPPRYGAPEAREISFRNGKQMMDVYLLRPLR
jgi:hypothetical protein